MSWKKPVFMLGAVLLCTSLLMASSPPGTTATNTQIAPALVKATVPDTVPATVSSAQAVLPDKTKAQGQAAASPMGLAPTPGAKPTGVRSGEECPPDSLFGQIPHGPDDAWSFGTSAITTSFDYLIQENYSDATGEICDIHWWGLSLYYSAGWSACDPTGMTFNIAFYPDEGGMPGAAVCTYTDVLPTVTSTGIFYAGLYEMWYWEIPSLDPCCNLIDGWVSIQSQMNDNDCAFLWASSPQGNGQSLQNGAPYLYDDAFCLTGEYQEQYGACCDDYTGECVDNVEYLQCDGRFTADTTCALLDPPCGPTGACCSAELVCLFTSVEAECDAVQGTWYEGEDCDAGFECPATCEHSITLWDDYGDGWNDGMLDVFVNGELVLDNITIVTGSGPETFVFQAATADTITTTYTPGGWPYENYYYIYDGNGTEICADGLAGTDPVGCTCSGYCGAAQTGACCVGGVCIGTMPEADCELSGWPDAWYEGEDCATFECPGGPPTTRFTTTAATISSTGSLAIGGLPPATSRPGL